MKRFFHSELEAFRGNIVLMGERAIELVRMSMEALNERDIDLARDVLEKDDELDQLEIQIDTEVVRYISLRAPVATELRLLTIGMKAAHDLERVGDEACTIAKQARELAGSATTLPLEKLPMMSSLAIRMLRDAIDSFLNEDLDLAVGIPRRDKEVDLLNKENYAIYQHLMAKEPEHIGMFFRLVFISKSLERIADHATNLAEEVIFLYHGRDIRHSETTRRST